MKKKLKKLSALSMAALMGLSLTACSTAGGEGKQAASGEFAKTKIAVCLYEDSTEYSKGMQAYIKQLGEAMNCEVTFGLYDMMDEAANIETTTQLISSGVQGIIGMTDVGTSTIIDECEAAGVYYASYLCDLNTSNMMDHDHVFGNDYFIGGIADGYKSDSDELGKVYFESLLKYNEAHPDAMLTHVSFTIFPEFSHPAQKANVERFCKLVDEYNETAETKIVYDPLDENVDVLMFSPLDETYFAKHADVDAIVSFADGTNFVYPTMVSAGVDKSVKLITAAFTDTLMENFGSKGTQTIQQMTTTPFEDIVYPLVLMINKLNGVSFADQPESAEIVNSSIFIANDDESMEKLANSISVTYDVEDALVKPDMIADYTAVTNPNATYADLVKLAQGFSLDQITID